MVWPWKRGGGRGDRALDGVGQQASGPALSDESLVGSSGSSTRAPGPPRPASGIELSGLRVIPTGAVSADRPAHDLAGVDASGRPIEVPVLGRPGGILLAFLAVDCFGCEPFWQGIGDPAILDSNQNVARVVVTKGPEQVPLGEVAAKSAGLRGVPTVMSTAAWTDYRVLSYPSFLLVDGPSGRVIGETVATGWGDVGSMMASIGA